MKLVLTAMLVDGAGAVPVSRRPNVMMPDEYLPPNKILFLQNLPENVTKDQLMALFSQYGRMRFDILVLLLTFPRYPNLYEVRLIPTKKDIAFVEYLDEASATVAKDALHNYKLDGENKIKVSSRFLSSPFINSISLCRLRSRGSNGFSAAFDLYCSFSLRSWVYQYIILLYLLQRCLKLGLPSAGT